jgi:hypothetical protein
MVALWSAFWASTITVSTVEIAAKTGITEDETVSEAEVRKEF